jgi:hypothetical protein
MEKRTSLQTYWTRIFTPAILILFVMAIYLVLTMPTIQTISSSSLFKTIRAIQKLKA